MVPGRLAPNPRLKPGHGCFASKGLPRRRSVGTGDLAIRRTSRAWRAERRRPGVLRLLCDDPSATSLACAPAGTDNKPLPRCQPLAAFAQEPSRSRAEELRLRFFGFIRLANVCHKLKHGLYRRRPPAAMDRRRQRALLHRHRWIPLHGSRRYRRDVQLGRAGSFVRPRWRRQLRRGPGRAYPRERPSP